MMRPTYFRRNKPQPHSLQKKTKLQLQPLSLSTNPTQGRRRLVLAASVTSSSSRVDALLLDLAVMLLSMLNPSSAATPSSSCLSSHQRSIARPRCTPYPRSSTVGSSLAASSTIGQIPPPARSSLENPKSVQRVLRQPGAPPQIQNLASFEGLRSQLQRDFGGFIG